MNHAEKIKKLLRLARDHAASPAEAANALNRAMELIERHNVDVSALDLDAETEKFVTERIRVGARLSQAKFLIANLIINYFPVRVTLSSRTISGFRNMREKDLAFMGTEADVTIAIYVFEFLVRASSQALSDYKAGEKKARRRVTPRKNEGFLQGWIYGVASLLKRPEHDAALEAGKSIVLSKRETALDAYQREQFPEAGTIKREKKTNPNAVSAGWIEGRKTTINTPLNAPEQEQLCLQ